MKHLKRMLAICGMGLFMTHGAMASSAVELQEVLVSQGYGGASEVRLRFNKPSPMPSAFLMRNPVQAVFDFANVQVVSGLRRNDNIVGVVQGVQVRSTKNKARIEVRLAQLAQYQIRMEGSDQVISFGVGQAHQAAYRPVGQTAYPGTPTAYPSGIPGAQGYMPQAPMMYPNHAGGSMMPPQAMAPGYPMPAPNGYMNYYGGAQGGNLLPILNRHGLPDANQGLNSLQEIDFRREPNGSGKAIFKLPRENMSYIEDRVGNVLKLTFNDLDVPPYLQKRLSVLDFATPVTSISATQSHLAAEIQIHVSGDFTHKIEQYNNVMNVIIAKKKVQRDLSNRNKEKKVFKGEKLSLNFQDIEIRAVIQLLADFTGKNIVVSDSVQGNITVRLKDIPWDQALDIVVKSKNLGMRENGNVIWIAPAAELEQKEADVLEALRRKEDLQDLVTDYIPINFAKAAELAKLIRKDHAGDKMNSGSLLSPKGNVSWDERTNTLLVQDTYSRVKEIRDLVKILDVPIEQVLIESRIVVANNEFSKNLGARFGVTPAWSAINGGKSAGMLGNIEGSTNFYNSLRANKTAAIPSLNDRLSVNLPVKGNAGKFGFSILTKDFLLDLELSALQADREGEVISTPRVITSNQTKATIQQGVDIPYQNAGKDGTTSVQFKKATLKLEVTPQITPDEHVFLDLTVNQDTVGQVYSGVPSINTRQVSTKVLVENGQTVVLGGVHESSRQNDEEKIPVLGDLPVVGSLFRNQSKSDVKRELLIFVTPKIVRGSNTEDLE